VEVKSRENPPDLDAGAVRRLRIRDRLYRALRKDVRYERVIIIDPNLPDIVRSPESGSWVNHAIAQVTQAEAELTIRREPAPAAYVIFMNHPHHYNLSAAEAGTTVVAAGFKISDFGCNSEPRRYRDLILAREKHVEIFDLLRSLKTHTVVPATFDGDHPEFALDPELTKYRLKIGEVYSVPTQTGEVEPGQLESAILVPETKEITGIYRLQVAYASLCDALPATERLRHISVIQKRFLAKFSMWVAARRTRLSLLISFTRHTNIHLRKSCWSF
jgi:hypothetical protein